MDLKLGLFLFTLYAVALGEECEKIELDPLMCHVTVKCNGSLEKLKEKIYNEKCITAPKTGVKPRLTLQIENLNMDEDNLKEIDSLDVKILDKIVNLVLTNVNIALVPESIYKMTSLEEVNLSNNKIKKIDIAKLINQTLVKITISNNTINTLERSGNVLRESNVTHIDLSHNQIQSIPVLFFGNCKKLVNLDLSYNSIKTLNQATFFNLESLTTLSFSHNNLNKIHDDFNRLENLETLALDNNNIGLIDVGAFITMNNLKALNLSSNGLTDEVTGTLKHLTNLKSLDLSNNKLTVIKKGSFEKNTELNDLFLTNNWITNIESGAFKNKSITKFDFKNNILKGSLKSDMLEGLFLNELDLSHGQITEIGPFCFSAMKTLKTLFLNNNNISIIDSSAFDNNTVLEYLDVSYNNLSKINLKNKSLQNLKTLNVSHNYIDEVKPEVLNFFKQLKYLDLSCNTIHEIKINTFKELGKLLTLDLQQNPLQKNIYKNSFDGLTNMEQLILKDTNLSSIEAEMISKMSNLKKLDLSFNQIQIIPENTFKNNKKIVEMDLSHNVIKDLSGVFKDFNDLATLKLANNKIQNIDKTTFSTLQKLTKIDMSYNEDLFLNSAFDGLPSLESVILKKIKSVTFEHILNSSISELDVSLCGIKDVNKIYLSKLKNIKTVNLCHNEITSVNINSFKDMTLLSKLSLCNNMIKDIEPKTFDSAPEIKEINISNNKLSEISYGTFNKLINLKTLDLAKNNLTSFPPGNLPDVETGTYLILDENSIKSLDFRGFSLKKPSKLSIGGNLISCSELKEASSKYKNLLTAKKIVNNTKNIEGISCRELPNTDGTIPSTNPTLPKESGTDTKNYLERLDQLLQEMKKMFNEIDQHNSINIDNLKQLNESFIETNNSSLPPQTKKVTYKKNFETLDKKINEIKQFLDSLNRIVEAISNKTDNWTNIDNETLVNINQQRIEANSTVQKLNTTLNGIYNKISNLPSSHTSQELKSVISESKTTKTLSYISAIGTMGLLIMLVVKCILQYKK